MVRTLAIIVIVATSSSGHACSGLVKQDVEGTSIFETVHEGDVIGGLATAVRDVVTGSMIVCGHKCYPAIGRFDTDDGPAAEIIELRSCAVGKMISNIAGVETYHLYDEIRPGPHSH